MFIRQRKNPSGSISIQIIDKSNSKYKVVETIACAKTSKDIRIVEGIIRGYYKQYKLPKDIPPVFTKGLSKRRLKDGTIHYKADGATEWIFIPD